MMVYENHELNTTAMVLNLPCEQRIVHAMMGYENHEINTTRLVLNLPCDGGMA
jgi:hypothetical protein